MGGNIKIYEESILFNDELKSIGEMLTIENQRFSSSPSQTFHSKWSSYIDCLETSIIKVAPFGAGFSGIIMNFQKRQNAPL